MGEKKKNANKTQLSSYFRLLKELWKDPLGKGILFFGFYFIFFIFLGVFYRTAPQRSAKKSLVIPSQVEQKTDLSLTKLLEGNYEFHYQESIGGKEKILEGKSSEKRKRVIDTFGQTYFLYSGISMKQQGSIWKISENPFYYPQLMNESYIEKVLKNANLESKTVYQTQEVLYHYQIATATLWDLYHKEQIDIADMPNLIDVLLSSEGDIKEIQYDYSNYESYFKKVPVVSKVKISYQNYGKVEKLEIPTS